LIAFRVSPDDDGERLDKVVAVRLGAIGRRGIAKLFREGRVRAGGRVASKGDRARENDEIVVALETADAVPPEPEAALDVRLETPSVVVVRKPAGMPTAPIRPGERGTLAGALLGRYPELRGIGYREREPGLLHRLDTQTSGLVVAVRTHAAFGRLRRALEEGRIEKSYLSIVEAEGLGDGGTVTAPLAPDPRDPRRVAVTADGAARARALRTTWRRLDVRGRFALVEARASHAYRHQIRAHLAWIHHPIAGDALYGGPRVPSLGDRHALHASYVAWAGDDAVPAFAVEDALPDDLAALFFG
jgi:23S rRNA pseudouridine1911/1915/1917 synthase